MPEPAPVDLLDVIAFVRVVETGSIANAATRLGIAKSIVSRRVSRLEGVLGAQLLTRTPRGTTLTDIGREYHERAAAGLSELESAREVVTKSTSEIFGQLRIQVPAAFGEFLLAPILAEFAARYPRIEFDVRFTDRQVDMIAEAYDLAIWPGAVPDSILITRKLAKVRWAMVASPAYLDARGRPARPADLADHDTILYALDPGRWRLQGPDGWEHVRINSRFCTDNGQMLLAAARASLGIVLVPMFMVEEPLARGEFEAVLPDFPHEGGDLQIFMPPARAGIARVRALVDFLYEKFDREI
ncbi:LysR family transcriptional regulator [Sphingomonas sp. BT-65]|uniref:LysR family transcriptional regulator n=1 Tax=Sphingomonas sp. BT-65 TaxID=2989821 RepID=UPI00223551C3|nr:LysR family transcriptional regulator [Sphingomonas sp. BT-65]MCW4460881.1 LysR family transcriptional regulator [Sphingomonas sp. BT-65]